MALGGDQGGSIRIPAAMCGIVGLKPTFGLVPYTGICSIEYSIDHTGPMARNVHDVALLLEVGEPYLKGVLITTVTVTERDSDRDSDNMMAMIKTAMVTTARLMADQSNSEFCLARKLINSPKYESQKTRDRVIDFCLTSRSLLVLTMIKIHVKLKLQKDHSPLPKK